VGIVCQVHTLGLSIYTTCTVFTPSIRSLVFVIYICSASLTSDLVNRCCKEETRVFNNLPFAMVLGFDYLIFLSILLGYLCRTVQIKLSRL
jgi:hypothetical protein